jgi:hypothetical protein
MIGASIYGFVDYKKTSRNKAFTEMYEEKTVKEPVVITADVIPEPVVNKEISISKKTEPEKVVVNNDPARKTAVKKVKKTKKRKFDTRLFSRGALDERYIDKPAKTEEPKKEVKITEIKEQ